MLGLAGRELIFFLIISMRLCLVLLEINSQYRDILALAEQSFHSAKAFDTSYPSPEETGLGLHKELGGNTAGTDDPN